MNGLFAAEAVLVPTDCRFSGSCGAFPSHSLQSLRDFADSGVVVPSHASW